MSAPVSENILLGFDDFLADLDEQTRAPIEEHLSIVPPENRELEKQHLASVFAVADATGLDLDTVHENWDTVRGGYAEQQAGAWPAITDDPPTYSDNPSKLSITVGNSDAVQHERDWLAVRDDEDKFFGKMQNQAARDRSERWLLEGQDSDDETGRISRAASLQERLFRGVALDRTAMDVFSEWQRDSVDKPGYDKRRADLYANQARMFFAAARARLEPVMPIAKEAFATISNDQELETTSEQLYGRVSQLNDSQRRDLLAALRVVADSHPDAAPTFWSNLGKSTTRAVGRKWRSVADVASGIWEIMKLSASFDAPDEETAPPGQYASEKQIARMQQLFGEHNLESDLRRIQESNWSPVKELWPKGWPQKIERGIYAMPDAGISSGTAIIPFVGMPATYANMATDAYESERFRLLDAGMSDHAASEGALRLAPIIAVPQALLEKVGADAVLLRKLPFFTGAMKRLGDAFGGGGKGFAARALVGAGTEWMTEMGQNLMQPIVETVAAALDKDLPGLQWSGEGGVLDGWWSQSGETFIALLPLAVAGVAGDARAKAVGHASDLQLRAFGAKEADILSFHEAVSEGGDSAELAAEHLLANRDANSEAAKAATMELRHAEVEHISLTAAQEAADNREAGVSRIVRNAEGWLVEREDGTSIQANTAAAARQIRDELKHAATPTEGENEGSELGHENPHETENNPTPHAKETGTPPSFGQLEREFKDQYADPAKIVEKLTHPDGPIILSSDDLLADTVKAAGIDRGPRVHQKLLTLANRARDRAFEHLLAQPITGKGRVVFLAGGPGSGKSTYARRLKGVDFVYDSVLQNPQTARKMIEQVLAKGRSVQLVLVIRNPADAMRGNLERALKEYRVVPTQGLAEAHVKARETAKMIAAELPRVSVRVVETLGKGQTRPVPLDSLPDLNLDETLNITHHILDEIEAGKDPKWKHGPVPASILGAAHGR